MFTTQPFASVNHDAQHFPRNQFDQKVFNYDFDEELARPMHDPH